MRTTNRIIYLQPKKAKPVSVLFVRLTYGDAHTEQYTGQEATSMEHPAIAVQYSVCESKMTAVTYLMRYQLPTN